MATNGGWTLSIQNGKKVNSKPFVLPLIIEREANCTIYDTTTGKVSKREMPDFFSVDVLYMLEFDDNVGDINDQLECVFLRPLP